MSALDRAYELIGGDKRSMGLQGHSAICRQPNDLPPSIYKAEIVLMIGIIFEVERIESPVGESLGQ